MSQRILVGDVRQVLTTLPDQSVHCCVTSPPYFGLRDYGADGQIGLEPTLAEYVTTMVGVFTEVWRVLRDDGTLWLNLGDSYAANRPGGAPAPTNTGNRKGYLVSGKQGVMSVPSGLKPKDLMGVPWRVAFALQDDGWYLRSDIIWAKPNPTPESVTDRPTKSHEYIFLLTKRPRYYYDADAVREPQTGNGQGQHFRNSPKYVDHVADKDSNHSERLGDLREANGYNPAGRNKRTVWTIPTAPFPGAHFATFPPALVEPCIKAGSREGDTVLDPFMGAGTTLLVADRLGRNGIGVEINEQYAQMARDRIAADAPMFADVAVEPVMPLFEAAGVEVA